MKGLEFVFLALVSVFGAFLRYKITESPLIFNITTKRFDCQCKAFILGEITTMES